MSVLLAVDASASTSQFSNLYDTLEQVKMQMIEGSLDQFISIATTVGGLGALFYMAYRVWGSMARAEPIDVFPLLRPFVLGLLIMNFSWVTEFLDTVVSPIEAATTSMVSGGQDELTDSRLARQKALEVQNAKEGKAYLNSNEEYDKKMDEMGLDLVGVVKVWGENTIYQFKKGAIDFLHEVLQWIVEAVKLAIAVVSTFYLIMLSILGPLVFGFACFDGFGHGITAWISRYISISLWVPICDVLSTLLNKIEILMNKIDIETLQTTGTGDDASYWFFIVFYIIALIAYSTVPTIAGWIVEAGGGTSGLNHNIASVGMSVAKAPSAVAGMAMGAATGLAGLASAKALKGIKKGFDGVAHGSGGAKNSKGNTGSAPQG